MELTVWEVDETRALSEEGVSNTSLAKKFGACLARHGKHHGSKLGGHEEDESEDYS